MGGMTMPRMKLNVSILSAVFKNFMNSVDIFDQQRSYNPTKRRDQLASMKMFTFVLNETLQNA